MQRQPLRHVSLWLDELSVGDGAFLQALDWACRLGLPLRVVATTAGNGLIQRDSAHDSDLGDRERAPLLEKIKTWGIACSRRGIAMETIFWQGKTEVGIEQFLRPGGLCVFEEERSDPLREKLLAGSLANGKVLLLLTPPNSLPMKRVLILYHHQNPSAFFMESAARLCQLLGVQPLILTMASSEQEALLKQSFAEGVCSSLRLQADFDSVVAFDLRSAVDRVAAWRNCSHVFFERPRNILTISLWQRLRGDIFTELRSLSNSLTLLALPEALALEVPSAMRGDHPIQPRDCSHPDDTMASSIHAGANYNRGNV